MNIIGDIAGRFDELMLLLAKMPQNEQILLVGDIIDRGSQSKEVVEWAMNTPNVKTLMGNHELMMVDCFENTGTWDWIWQQNGGYATMKSFDVKHPEELPADVINWMRNLPVFHREEGLYVSHAPWPNDLYNLGQYSGVNEVVWNRHFIPVEGVFQIFGHNGRIKHWPGQGMCIDNSMAKQVSGYHWPSKQFYFEDYKEVAKITE